MQTYSVRDLRERTGDIIHGAEEGKLALITKHSKPVFLAVPFNELMIENGVHMALAIKLYRDHIVSLEKASKIARLPLEEFMKKLAVLSMSIVDYPPADVEKELRVISKLLKKK